MWDSLCQWSVVDGVGDCVYDSEGELLGLLVRINEPPVADVEEAALPPPPPPNGT